MADEDFSVNDAIQNRLRLIETIKKQEIVVANKACVALSNEALEDLHKEENFLKILKNIRRG